MRAPMLFTTRAIEDLDLEAHENDVWVWDSDDGQHSGLGLRMRRGKGGTTKRWYATYSYGGQHRRDPLGKHLTLADARAEANRIMRGLENDPSKDPREAKLTAKAAAIAASEIPTFGDFAIAYILENSKRWRPATLRNAERYLADGPQSKPFKGLRLDLVTKAMIASHVKLLESKGIDGSTRETSAKPSKSTAYAWRDAVKRMFNAAIKAGLVEKNPVHGAYAPEKGAPRSRVLSNDELATVWNASSDDTYGKLTKLAILLGNRRQELGGMRWSEIEDGVWKIPGKRTKTKKLLWLPLPPAALDIIRSVPKVDEDGLIFAGGTGKEYDSWSDRKKDLDERIGIAPWRFHDHRRTLVSGMQKLGVLPHIIEAIVNHAPPRTVHNIHYADQPDRYLDDKAKALRDWADHVLALAGKNVAPLKVAA